MKRFVAIFVLSIVYGITLALAKCCKAVIRPCRVRRRIIINGTFHNPNWFFAHIEPLVRANYGEIILVCDEPVAPLPGLTYVCPPKWAAQIFSRAGAKLIWTFLTGVRQPADIYVGYHIFPSAITALICARIFGAKAIYQVTSGPLELSGGGWNAENALLSALGKPSDIVANLAFAVTRQFDLCVVRGSSAKQFLSTINFSNQVEVVTGSVQVDDKCGQCDRDIDVIFVGRLVEVKRIDRIIKITKDLVVSNPTIKVAIVGNGPEMDKLQKQVSALQLNKNIEFLGQRSDVPNLVGRSKVFVLTSRSEGVSIAMLEAMALRVVPVVSDVGDLNDFVINGETGFLVDQDDLQGFSERIGNLLSDTSTRTTLAEASRDKILLTSERQALAKRWFAILQDLAKTEDFSEKEKLKFN